MPLHPSHQLEELPPPLMGAIGKQWNAARGQKEAEHCWCGRVTEWVRVMNVCKSPSVFAESWIHPLGGGGEDPVVLRWTRDKIQRLVTCGRRLGDVVADSCRGILLPFGLRMLEIGR